MLALAQQSIISPQVLQPVLKARAVELARRKSNSKTRTNSKQPIKKPKVITMVEEKIKMPLKADKSSLDKSDRLSPNVRLLSSACHNSVLASSRKSDIKQPTSRTISQHNAPAFL